jgi:ABC-type antimicrobial peptide transport system permease subunit
MTKNQRRKFLIDLALRFVVIFTVIIIVLSVIGLIIAGNNSKEHDITKIFTRENKGLSDIYIMTPGLSYSYILTLAFIVFIITLISFLAEYLLKKNKNRYDELFKRHKIYRKKKMT